MHPTPSASDRDLPSRLRWLLEMPFAQRGWHDIGQHIPENSLIAFDAAVEAGYGIQLDVRPTIDMHAVVFHDATLERLTEEDGHVAGLDAEALSRIRLRHSDQSIVTLETALWHIRGRAPVLIQAYGAGADPTQVCLPIRRALEGYRGSVAVMSADPAITGWFARHAPSVVRGLVLPQGALDASGLLDRLGIGRQLSLWKSNPDFLACDLSLVAHPFVQKARARGLPVLAYTVREDPDQDLADALADNILFEGPRTLLAIHAIKP